MGPTRRGGAGEPGLALVELVLVIAIVALLASVLTLGIRRISESFALRQAASMAVAEIRQAQAGALSQGVDHVVEFDTSGASGPPGGLRLFRPGVAVTGPVSVTSSGGSDTRSVTVVGIDEGRMTADTLFLNGTTVITSPVTFAWILEAETPTPNSCCTIAIKQGATTVATIGPSQSRATLPWTVVRTTRTPEWPQPVRMDAGGTTLPLCSTLGAPWTASSAHCLRFRPLGFPDQAGVVLLCSGGRVPRRIVIAAGTGQVSVERVGICP